MTTTMLMLRKPLLTMNNGIQKSQDSVIRFMNTSKQILQQQQKQPITTSCINYHRTVTSSTRSHRVLLSPCFQQSQSRALIHNNNNNRSILSRNFSDKKGTRNEIPNEERNEIVLTPGQKVAAGTRLTMYLGMFGAAATFLYFTVRELLPTKMSPNTVFNKAHAIISNDSGVTYRYGSPIKTYGRDHGGKREGRRNFIEHSEYVDQEDGSKRVRVRFNLEGPKGNAFVFGEVSNKMPSGEFVYLLVQDKRNGVVNTLIDNRSMLAAKQMTAGSKEGEEAFANLLGGGRSN